MRGSSVDLIVVRHGQSAWNAESRFQGHLGTGLSDLGRRQAAEVAHALRVQLGDVPAVVSSDLRRVRETAASYLEAVGRTAHYDRAWREIDVGGWGGLLPHEVAERFPDEFAAFGRGEDVRRGGGETFAELRTRSWQAIGDLADRARGTHPVILVFSHAGPIRTAAAEALGLPPMGHLWLRQPANCSVSRFRQHFHDGRRSRCDLLWYNVAAEGMATAMEREAG